MVPKSLGALCSEAGSPSAPRNLHLLHARVALGISSQQQQAARMSVAWHGVLNTVHSEVWC